MLDTVRLRPTSETWNHEDGDSDMRKFEFVGVLRRIFHGRLKWGHTIKDVEVYRYLKVCTSYIERMRKYGMCITRDRPELDEEHSDDSDESAI